MEKRESGGEVMELKIRKEFEELQPSMSEDEFEALLNSMKERGYDKAFPIITDETDTILDGHHRYKASNQLKITPEVFQRKGFKDNFEKMDFIWLCSLRRNLNLWQKAEQAKKKEALEAQKAKARQGGKGIPKTESSPIGDNAGRTEEILAKQVGIGQGTLQRAFKIMEEASEEVKKKLGSGEWSVNYAYNGYNAIGKAPQDKQAILKEQFENEELMAPQITKLIEESQKAVELLGNTSEKIQKDFEEKYKDEFWTADLKFKDLLKEVSIAEGNPANLIEREIEQTLMTKDEVTKMSKKVGGYYVGERHYWVIMVDPLLFEAPKKKKSEEDEEE